MNGPSKLDPKFLESLWAISECGDPSGRTTRATNRVMEALDRGEAVPVGGSMCGFDGSGGGSGGKPKKEKKSKKDRGRQDTFDAGFADLPGTAGQMAPSAPGHNFGPAVPVGVPMGGPMSAATGVPMGAPQSMMQQQMPQMQPYGHEAHMHQQQIPPPFPPAQTQTNLNVDMQLQNELAEIDKQIDQLKGSSLPGTMLPAGYTTPGSGFGAGGFPGGSGFVGSCGTNCAGANSCGGNAFGTGPCGGGSFGDEESDSDSDNDWWHQAPPTGIAGGFGGPQPAPQSFSQW